MSRPTLTVVFSTATGLSPILLRFPTHSPFITTRPGPRSLATTDGVSIDVLSSGYLDVSVPRVRSWKPMYSATKYLIDPADLCPGGQTSAWCQVGSPIRKFPDQRVLSPPRDLSQSATSFIASCRQGIHQTPFSRLIRSRWSGTRPPSDRDVAISLPRPHRPASIRRPVTTGSVRFSFDLERPHTRSHLTSCLRFSLSSRCQPGRRSDPRPKTSSRPAKRA